MQSTFEEYSVPTSVILKQSFEKFNISLEMNHQLESSLLADFAIPNQKVAIQMHYACDYCVDSSHLKGDVRLRNHLLEKSGWSLVCVPYWLTPDRSITRLNSLVRTNLIEILQVALPLPSLDDFKTGRERFKEVQAKREAEKRRKKLATSISREINQRV